MAMITKTLHACFLMSVLALTGGPLWSQGGDGGASVASNLSQPSEPEKSHRPASKSELRDDAFIIGVDDVLSINVWKEPEISKIVSVRPDRRISLPLIGEVLAAGQTPRQVEAEIAAKLKDFVTEPEVTVIVQEIKSQKFNILGMVMHPGAYPLTRPTNVLDAIALAGGFRDFARQKDVYILRSDAAGKQVRLSFNYRNVIRGRSPQQNVELRSSDTIVVP
jgi:polysaccharide biosynthesis/export protein